MRVKQRAGFSIIEVVVALMILCVGVLAMGASTGHVMAEIQSSGLRTERNGAVRQAAEMLRGTDWTALESACTPTPYLSTEHYAVTCAVFRPASALKEVRIVSTGPGFRGGRFDVAMADTFAISIAEPVP